MDKWNKLKETIQLYLETLESHIAQYPSNYVEGQTDCANKILRYVEQLEQEEKQD